MVSQLSTLISLVLCAIATQAQFLDRPRIYLNGKLYNDLGEPLPNAVVQIWQTDDRGVYDHPNSLADLGEALEPDFQYYGMSTTDAQGLFSFVTIRPGVYQNRPTHIHFKVLDSADLFATELLTSQFYFADEPDRGTPESLRLVLEPHPIIPNAWSTSTSVTVDTGRGGTAPLTVPQQEGPFYPVVVDFGSADGDLTTVVNSESTTSTTTVSTTGGTVTTGTTGATAGVSVSATGGSSAGGTITTTVTTTTTGGTTATSTESSTTETSTTTSSSSTDGTPDLSPLDSGAVVANMMRFGTMVVIATVVMTFLG